MPFSRPLKALVSLPVLWLPLALAPTPLHAQRLMHTFEAPSPTRGERFGMRIAISGNHVVAASHPAGLLGADALYLFDVMSGELRHTYSAPESAAGVFTDSAIDGDRIASGSSWADGNRGAAYLWSTATGELLHTFRDPMPTKWEHFGITVVMGGNYLATETITDDVGRVHGVHVFDVEGHDLVRTFDNPNPTSGRLIPQAIQGNRLLTAGHQSVGQAQLFDISSGNVIQAFDDPTPDGSNVFGRPGALFGDYVYGEVHLFDLDSGDLVTTINNPSDGLDFFGIDVVLEGNQVLIGAPEADVGNISDAGRVYLFDISDLTTSTPGDFNNDGLLTAEDIDLLTAEIQDAEPNLIFDLDGDEQVADSDRDSWVASHDFAHTFFGDANLDGEFNSSDLVAVFESGEYEDSVAGNSGWAEGDWNGDGDFTSSDLVTAFVDGGYEQGPRAAVRAVPEPSGFTMMCSLLITLSVASTGRRSAISRAAV